MAKKCPARHSEIPARTVLRGVRDFIRARIEEIAGSLTRSARATHELTYDRIMPPVINDGRLAARALEILNESFGPGTVTDDLAPSMGCEEFAL